MSPYIGGSAPAMVKQVTEGYTLVNTVSLKRLTDSELDTLGFELEKKLREIRAEQPDLDDIASLQQRNRRMQRLDNALRVLRATLQGRRRG
jgi:hypothetical protein